jgi:hypothetical protein
MAVRSILAGIGLCAFFSACTALTSPSPTPDPGLSISYLFATETTFVNIEVKQGVLSYTRFEDAQDRCARWIEQRPCWTDDDLKTAAFVLSAIDAQDLQNLVEQTHFMNLSPAEQVVPEGQRFYPYSLRVELGTQTTEIVYPSYPDAPSMPEAMSRLITFLEKLAEQRYQGQSQETE